MSADGFEKRVMARIAGIKQFLAELPPPSDDETEWTRGMRRHYARELRALEAELEKYRIWRDGELKETKKKMKRERRK